MSEHNEMISNGNHSLDENATPKAYEQESTQLNHQDLDQIQCNSQNFRIAINDHSTGKIMGMVYRDASKTLIHNVDVSLYFGDHSETPVNKKKTDEAGYFEFDDLPPGFYTLLVQYKEFKYKFQYIQVSYNETIFKQLPLRA